MTVTTMTTQEEGIQVRAVSPAQIAELAQRIQGIAQRKRDYIVPATHLRMVDRAAAGEQPRVDLVAQLGGILGDVSYGIGKHAHAQIAEKLGIHGTYYRRMLDTPHALPLLAQNVNHWLEQARSNFLMRELDGRVRALLSDRYQPLDNTDLFFEAVRVVHNIGGQIVRADLTEERMYLRALVPDWREQVAHQRAALDAERGSMRGVHFDGFSDRLAGGIHKDPASMTIGERRNGGGGGVMERASRDYVCPGIVISNSEIGQGRVLVEPFVYAFYCSNYAVFGESLGRVHVGAKREHLGVLSDDTLRAEGAYVWGTIRDYIRATLDREQFRARLQRLVESTGEMLTAPQEAVDSVVKHYGLTDEERQRILNELISAGDPTVYGLLQAITATGRDTADTHRAIELERVGGQFVTAAPELVAVRR